MWNKYVGWLQVILGVLFIVGGFFSVLYFLNGVEETRVDYKNSLIKYREVVYNMSPEMSLLDGKLSYNINMMFISFYIIVIASAVIVLMLSLILILQGLVNIK